MSRNSKYLDYYIYIFLFIFFNTYIYLPINFEKKNALGVDFYNQVFNFSKVNNINLVIRLRFLFI